MHLSKSVICRTYYCIRWKSVFPFFGHTKTIVVYFPITLSQLKKQAFFIEQILSSQKYSLFARMLRLNRQTLSTWFSLYKFCDIKKIPDGNNEEVDGARDLKSTSGKQIRTMWAFYLESRKWIHFWLWFENCNIASLQTNRTIYFSFVLSMSLSKLPKKVFFQGIIAIILGQRGAIDCKQHLSSCFWKPVSPIWSRYKLSDRLTICCRSDRKIGGTPPTCSILLQQKLINCKIFSVFSLQKFESCSADLCDI